MSAMNRIVGQVVRSLNGRRAGRGTAPRTGGPVPRTGRPYGGPARRPAPGGRGGGPQSEVRSIVGSLRRLAAGRRGR